MNWKFWIPFFLIFGLSIDFYFLHFLFREKSKQLFLEEVQKMGFTQKNILPFKKVINTDHDIADSSKIANFQIEIKKCFENTVDLNLENLATPTQFFNSIFQSKNIQKNNQIENYIFFDPYGIEHRLHITPSNLDGQDKQVQLYNIDSDGYPMRVSLPDILNHKDWQKNIITYLKNFKVVLHQIKGQFIRGADAKIEYEVHDDKIFLLNYSQANFQFRCEQDSCFCHKTAN